MKSKSLSKAVNKIEGNLNLNVNRKKNIAMECLL